MMHKASLYSGTFLISNGGIIAGSGDNIVQPAVNFDPIATNSPAFFLAGNNYDQDRLYYSTATWSGTNCTFSGVWSAVTIPTGGVPPDSFYSSQKGGTRQVDFPSGRLQNAVIRNGNLWTCRALLVNQQGGSSAPDGQGCDWYRLAISGSSVTNLESGRVYDGSSTTPNSYSYCSICVNSRNDAILSFNGGGASIYVGAYYCGRLQSYAPGTMSAVGPLKAGDSYYAPAVQNPTDWGDYNASSLDPVDGITIWTCTEYPKTKTIWSSWIGTVTPTIR